MKILENSIFISDDTLDDFLEIIDPHYGENYHIWDYPNLTVKKYILDKFKDSYLITAQNLDGMTITGFSIVFASNEDFVEFKLKYLYNEI